MLRFLKFLHWARLRWLAIVLVTALIIPVIALGIPTHSSLNALVWARDTPESEVDVTAMMPPDIQAILDRGELIVAVLGKDNQPFFQEDSSKNPCTTDPKRSDEVVKIKGRKFCGLDIELGKAIADTLDVKVRYDRSAQTFNEVVERVFEHKADLAFSKISRTMARVKKVSFSKPYVNMSQGLLVNRVELAEQAEGRQIAEVFRALEGKVGVIKGSSYVGFTEQKFPDATAKEYPSWEDVIDAAREGKILAAYRDELEVKKIIRTYPDTALNFQTIALSDTNDAIAAVIPWDSNHLKEIVDQYLENHNADYTADKLLEKYEYMFVTASTTEQE